jgi:hypothetical protein
MPKDEVEVESFLSLAKQQEKEYDWLGAAGSYSNAVEAIPEDDFFKVGQPQEACAYALFRAAMQAENIEEFKDRLSKSEKQYEKAKQSYVKASSSASSSRVSRCEAMVAYSGFWQTSDVATKKKKVNEAWSLAKKAMDAFGNIEVLELAKTYNELFMSMVLLLHFSDDQEVRKTIRSEAIAYGENVTRLLSDTEDRDELVKALVNTVGCLEALSIVSVVSIDMIDSNHQKSMEYWRRAVELSEETALIAKTIADLPYGLESVIGKDYQRVNEKQLEYAKSTRDRLFFGVALGNLAYYEYWACQGREDPEDIKALIEETRRCVDEARREFEILGFLVPVYFGPIWVSSPSQWWYPFVKANCETDPKRKRELVRESVESARLELAAAGKSGYPSLVSLAQSRLGMSLVELAKTEGKEPQRVRLLEEAVRISTESSRGIDILMPSALWNRGISLCRLGMMELELGEILSRNESKKVSIDSSITHMRRGLDLIEKEFVDIAAALHEEAVLKVMSLHWRNYGRALRSDYGLTGIQETMSRSAMAFERAAEFDAKACLSSRVAESYWEAARAYDTLGEHLKAAERYEEASEQYRKAAEKIPTLSRLFQDESLYMKAWSEIEKARYHHARQEPASSKEHYDKAAKFHESSGKWSFLSANYLAWAQVENAEDLSQKERSKKSIDAFREASRLFRDSEAQMRERLAKIDSADEKQMVERLIESSDRREGLCQARVVLEEARLLDKEGKLGSASEKYGLVADMFAKIKQGLAADQDRKEIELIITLSKAWKAMAKAEVESSPERYEDAAHLFDEAKNLSPGDTAKNLAMGHSRFCKALQAGVKFSDTGDLTQHGIATDNLESAAKYYLKAGLESASEYARASSLLFDAYVHMSKARKEQDQAKKAKFYTLAEKILQASASSYDKADQPGKKDQVLKLLEKVQRDRELAVSLTEILRAPDVISTTMAFSSPTPTQETAVGLDRFEHAEVQATLIAKPNELHIGQELSLEIELVNAGRGAAQITRVDEVVPKGFDVVAAPEKCRIEDSCLNMRGRRLEALKSEDVKLVLKPTARGNFKLKPRIMYIDDSGSQKSCEPNPVEVAVREMGISGWIRGT